MPTTTQIKLICSALIALASMADLQGDQDEAAKPGAAVARLKEEAAKLAPLFKTTAVTEFLRAVDHLPSIEPRVVFRNSEKDRASSAAQVEKLSTAERADLQKREYDETFYYNTGYGSPLVYARPLELLAEQGIDSFSRRRIFDFGYGSVGHLRLLASVGADAVGSEVQPVFRALYSEPADQGIIKGGGGRQGQVRLIHGRWPGEAPVRQAVGDGYDIIVSKNVLKHGYIHPEREADERHLVKLGVDDHTFVQALFDALKPGGLVMIYNLAPAQNPPEKPYIPWADGRCPFERSLLESVGFRILAYNKQDDEAAYDIWFAMGYNEGQTREQLSKSLFAQYTLLRKPPLQ